MKRLEAEYDSKRNQLIKFYEAVKSTQDVALDDIPLPSLPVEGSKSSIKTNIELNEPTSILKKSSLLSKEIDKKPPGLPPGPPPSFRDLDVDFSDEEEEKFKKVRFGDEKETDISEFLKEIENVQKTVGKKDSSLLSKPSQSVGSISLSPSNLSSLSSQIQSGPPQSLLMLRPPTINNLSSVSLRPGIAPNSSLSRPGLMLPPPPPQSQIRPLTIPSTRMNINSRQSQVINLSQRSNSKKEDKKSSHLASDRATIEAKPQLRNLSADATRFLPVSLKVKRPEKSVKKSYKNDGKFLFLCYNNISFVKLFFLTFKASILVTLFHLKNMPKIQNLLQPKMTHMKSL